MDVDRQSKDRVANEDDEALELFVRSSPRELEPVDLDRVAGGNGGMMVPNG